MKITTLFWLCIIVVLTACKSDDKDTSPGAQEFPRNTEWVGVLDRSGYQYAPPANLQFKDNDKLVVYAPHFFVEAGVLIRIDSVQGTIKSVTELDKVTLQVVTSIEHYGQVTITIKDRKTLTSLSDNGNKPMPFTMEVYESSEPFGGLWQGPVMSGSGPTNGRIAYPDLSTITFHDQDATYTRNGQAVTTGTAGPGAEPSLLVLKTAYKRIGATVFMSGYNETTLQLVPYMGVLLPGNRKMMVHSNAIGARLPYYTQTIPWDGPIGQTPIIERP